MENNIWGHYELLKEKIAKLNDYDLLELYRMVNAENSSFNDFETWGLREVVDTYSTDEVMDIIVHGKINNYDDDIRTNEYGYWESVTEKQLIKEARDEDMIDELIEGLMYLDECSCFYDDIKEVLK